MIYTYICYLNFRFFRYDNAILMLTSEFIV